MKIAQINKAGIESMIGQTRAAYKNDVTDDVHAYRDDISALEEKANYLLIHGDSSGTVEREIGSAFTKSGRPEFITLLLNKHFSIAETSDEK